MFGDRLAHQAQALDHARRRAAAEVLLARIRAAGAVVTLVGDRVNVRGFAPSPQMVERIKGLKPYLVEALAAEATA